MSPGNHQLNCLRNKKVGAASFYSSVITQLKSEKVENIVLPVAPKGWPLEIKPPLGLTTNLPP